MAVLSSIERAMVCAHLQRPQQAFGGVGVSKAQLQAAVDATDQWIDDNAAAFNTALPAAFRTTATAQQKTLLFCYVALRRAGLLRTEGE